jgi:hypothetical protein
MELVMNNRRICKVVTTVFCWEDEVQQVKESLEQWFGDCEHSLFGAAPTVAEATPEEEAKARDGLDDGLGTEEDGEEG